MARVRELLRSLRPVHADETPARAAGGSPTCMWRARYLTLMHRRRGLAIASTPEGVPNPGYTGVIVRDGYAGYSHLTDAAHAWCGLICCAN